MAGRWGKGERVSPGKLDRCNRKRNLLEAKVASMHLKTAAAEAGTTLVLYGVAWLPSRSSWLRAKR
jgi:hypothetical protein